MKNCKNCKKDLDTIFFAVESNICKNCKYIQTKKRRSEQVILNENRLDFVESKECNKCNTTLKREEFNRLNTTPDGLSNTCRNCYNSLRKSKNVIVSDTNKSKSCNTCNKLKPLSDFGTCIKSSDKHFHKCKECQSPREWTKEKQKLSEKKYCEKNKEKLQEKWRKRQENVQHRIKQRLCARIKSALKEVSLRKTNKTYEYVGCSYDFLKQWIEFQFQGEMTWDTVGQWHIDHVIPCASFDLTNPNDSSECFSWKNLRPCWAEENMMKGSKIISEVIENQKKMVKQFLENPLPNLPGDREGGVK
jgi:hypothetical protein